MPGQPYEQGFDFRLVPGKVAEPLLWPGKSMVFVNSMSDLFHRDVPDAYIERVARVMAAADWHTYQVLTKRSERMSGLMRFSTLRFASILPHLWWGVSVEVRKHGLQRIEHLRSASAGLRFLSIKPLLEDLGPIDLDGIGWVIVGGESGPGARPLNGDWVVSIRDQCRKEGVPIFFKQRGGVRKSKAGRTLDGETLDGVPPRSDRPMPECGVRRELARSFEMA